MYSNEFSPQRTQSITEFYSFDFKLIKLCETLCPLCEKIHNRYGNESKQILDLY